MTIVELKKKYGPYTKAISKLRKEQFQIKQKCEEKLLENKKLDKMRGPTA